MKIVKMFRSAIVIHGERKYIQNPAMVLVSLKENLISICKASSDIQASS